MIIPVLPKRIIVAKLEINAGVISGTVRRAIHREGMLTPNFVINNARGIAIPTVMRVVRIPRRIVFQVTFIMYPKKSGGSGLVVSKNIETEEIMRVKMGITRNMVTKTMAAK